MSIEKPNQGNETPSLIPEQSELERSETEINPALLVEQEAERVRRIEALRERMAKRYENAENNTESSESLRGNQRRYEDTRPVKIDTADKERIGEYAARERQQLEKHYGRGFGIFPGQDPKENFYNQVWTRDLAHAGANYFGEENPQALVDSLQTVLSHQRKDGALPLRTERTYHLMSILPPLRSLAQPAFNFFERKLRGRKERPVYEGQDMGSGEDTVPATIVSAGEFFVASEEGRRFATEHFDNLERAAAYFTRTKVDPKDGLFSCKTGNADWADSINRGGKLGNINVLWARSLRLMSFMAGQFGEKEKGSEYRKEYLKTKKSIMEKIYNADEAYFRAEVGEDRIDTVATIFGSLYLLDPEECVRVQETLKERLKTPSGLKNFDPPYPKEQEMMLLRLAGMGGYHNDFVWPWVTCQNIHVKIKIALEHPDEEVRARFKQEAVDDLLDVTDLFEKAGGAYEIFLPDNRKPAKASLTKWRLHEPPNNFMANMSVYEGAYLQLHKLGWL